jgi:hypothetical protein
MPFHPDEVRAAAARVAGRARYVRVVEEAITGYAETLPAAGTPLDAGGRPVAGGIPDERRAAAALQLNAINFGSGWFPTLRKAPGMSGFRTVEAGLKAHGPWTATDLRALSAADVAAVVGQDPGHELMGLFAAALRELGEWVDERHGGSFAAVAAGGRALPVAQALAALPLWRDVSSHDGEPVPFFKRAQIAAADLLPDAPDLAVLTLFADNLVPHVLRLDGVLEFDPALVERIEREELIEHGSPEEVEIRACAVHATELLVAAHGSTTATAADHALWLRGGAPRYKARPRHRARTTAY